jgi:hypothetical protein
VDVEDGELDGLDSLDTPEDMELDMLEDTGAATAAVTDTAMATDTTITVEDTETRTEHTVTTVTADMAEGVKASSTAEVNSAVHARLQDINPTKIAILLFQEPVLL